MMHRLLMLLILSCSLVYAGCERAHSEARALVRTSESLNYAGFCVYSDGGSVGFVFTNQATQEVLIFLPNPGLAEGVVEKNGRKLQRVLVAPRMEFSSEEPMELKSRSRAEAKTTRLIRSALRTPNPDQKRQEVESLLEVIAERSFDWATFKAGYSETIPRMGTQPEQNPVETGN